MTDPMKVAQQVERDQHRLAKLAVGILLLLTAVNVVVLGVVAYIGLTTRDVGEAARDQGKVNEQLLREAQAAEENRAADQARRDADSVQFRQVLESVFALLGDNNRILRNLAGEPAGEGPSASLPFTTTTTQPAATGPPETAPESTTTRPPPTTQAPAQPICVVVICPPLPGG